ncbi:Hypothetical predicted protein [Mytilus galloprovincialis]|uniref:Uncharacterized protein n=1 Tax=Mytilus galloprovincialis TaxID=29158 RepID=A0A8B6BGG8_MYTGA|nr:Hypothetical predicted protein [Mytilus galloprovincialis]
MPPKARPRRNRSEDDEIEILTNLSSFIFKPSHTKGIFKPSIILYGNVDEDIDSWLKYFDRIATANQYHAAAFHESLEEDRKEDTATLCESLWKSARQREGQNFEDASETCNTCIFRYDKRTKDVLIKEHFIQGLKQDIKRFVMSSNPTTYEGAYRSAKIEKCNTNRDRQTVAA